MLRFPQRLALCGVTCALLVAVGLLAWGLPTGSSEALSGSMQNCPPAGMWSIAVWDGTSGTAAADALATCGADAVAAAYSLDPQTGGWSRWFAGNTTASNMAPLNDMQGIIGLGNPSLGLTPTPTPEPTHCTIFGAYPSPPSEVASGLLIIRVVDYDATPLRDTTVKLRFLSPAPSGVHVLTDQVTKLTDAEGNAAFDARNMLPPSSSMIPALDECSGPVDVLADVEVQASGNILQFQASVDLLYGALFNIIGAGRPYEGGPYVPLPVVDWDETWFYHVLTPPAGCPSLWEASVEASVSIFRPALLDGGDCQ